MTLPINPDLEQLHIPPLTPGERVKRFEDAVSLYGLASAALRDVSVEISKVGQPVPDFMRLRLQQAAQDDERSKRMVIAQAKILAASGLLERAREALDAETAERL